MLRVGFLGPAFAHDVIREALGPQAEVIELPLDAAALVGAMTDLDALLDASTRIAISAAALRGCDRLKIISLASTGSSHVDEGAAAEAGIVVRTLREDASLLAGLTPAAEHTWALVLACARRLPAAARHVEEGGWDRERFPGVMLRGQTLGVIGLGRIGSWVARYGNAFGMRVTAVDPGRDEWPEDVEPVPLEQLMMESDVITIHVHLDGGTEGMINRSLLGRCKPTAIVVNTSRGGIVDEPALIEMLGHDRLGAVGLDVLQHEPPPGDGLLLLAARADDRLIVTPHVGGFSPDAVLMVCRRAAEKIREHFESLR